MDKTKKYRITIQYYSDFLFWYFDKYERDNYNEDADSYEHRHEQMTNASLFILKCITNKELLKAFKTLVYDYIQPDEYDDFDKRYKKAIKTFYEDLKQDLKKDLKERKKYKKGTY